MILYIAGPMTGLPEHNAPAFHAAEHTLREAGHHPINPCTIDIDPAATWADCLRVDIRRGLLQADGVAVLDDWTSSRGARLEVHIAAELGMPIRPVTEWVAAQ